jgi:hypothetical protein
VRERAAAATTRICGAPTRTYLTGDPSSIGDITAVAPHECWTFPHREDNPRTTLAEHRVLLVQRQVLYDLVSQGHDRGGLEGVDVRLLRHSEVRAGTPAEGPPGAEQESCDKLEGARIGDIALDDIRVQHALIEPAGAEDLLVDDQNLRCTPR